MLEKIKLSLGITHNKLDTDIQDVIEACLIDLGIAGVDKLIDEDPLVCAAVKLYCKAWYNFQGQAEQYRIAYASTKNTMAMAGEYSAE